MDRRGFIAAGMGAAAAMATAPVRAAMQHQGMPQEPIAQPEGGRLRQSVCRWCLARQDLAQVCELARRCGVQSVELLDPDDIERVRERGLQCAIANGPCTIGKGLNRLEHHAEIVQRAERLFPRIAAAGCEQVIVFAGNRDGLDDQTGLWNCAVGLRRLLPIAEASGLWMAMELLNSRIDHRDHMGDRVAWGVQLCNTVSHNRFGLLYDIYHMQIMDGDVIRNMTGNVHWIRHVHTAGVPGRGPLDAEQELNYSAIIRALHRAGYTRWIGHEFAPRIDVEAELKAAVAACLG
jgi:hydroxypyruvate isomerase